MPFNVRIGLPLTSHGRTNIADILSILSGGAIMALWTPAELTTLLWLDADDAATITIDTGVGQWADKSGNNRHAVQTTDANQPVITAGGLNGKNIVTFDGSSDFLEIAGSIGTNVSIFYVQITADTPYIVLNENSLTTDFGACAQSGSAAAVSTNFGTPTYYKNGASQTWANRGQVYTALHNAPHIVGAVNANLTSWTSARISGYTASSTFLLAGSIAEMIIISGSISTDDRQLIEGYLAWKWGLEGSLAADHPYKDAAPTIAAQLVTLSLNQPISLAQLVTLSLDQPIALRKLLTLSLDQSSGMELSMSLIQRCRAMPQVTMSLNQWVRSLRQITLRLDQHVGVCPLVRLSLDQHVKMPGRVTLSLDQSVVIAGQLLAMSLDQPVNMANNGRVTMSLAQPCAIASGEAIRQGISLSVTVGGRLVEPDYVSIKADDSDGFLSATIRFPDPAQYALCRVGETVVITELLDELPAEITVLRVQTLANPEEPGAADHILTAVSPTIALDEEPLTDDLGPGVAAALMTALAAGYGITLDWQGVEGWPFLAGELMAEDETAYQVLVRLAAASGAFVQSMPDGETIRLRPEYAVNVGTWPTAATDLEINDQDHIFSIDEQPDERDGFNAFMVGGQSSAAGNHHLDDKPLTATTKDVKFYHWPWNAAKAIVLGHTGGDWVSIDYLGVHEEIVTDENVVVTAGIGRLQLPCYGLVSYQYKEDGLGAVTFEEDGSIATAVLGDALLDVTYKTKYRRWLLTDPRAEHLLIYVD